MSLSNTVIAEATNTSAFAGTEPCMYAFSDEKSQDKLDETKPVLNERSFSFPSTGLRVGRITALRIRALRLGSSGLSRTFSIEEMKMVMSQSLEQIPGSMSRPK